MDEAAEVQQELVKVVAYEDVRAIAEDAASTALVADGAADDREIGDVAQDAAQKAAEGVAETVKDAVSEEALELAAESAEISGAKAAEVVAEDYSGRIDELLGEVRTLSEQQAEAVGVVQIEDAQMQELREYMRAAVWTNLVVSIMVGMLTGVMLWHSIVGRR